MQLQEPAAPEAKDVVGAQVAAVVHVDVDRLLHRGDVLRPDPVVVSPQRKIEARIAEPASPGEQYERAILIHHWFQEDRGAAIGEREDDLDTRPWRVRRLRRRVDAGI